jgi:hypothetical protein
MRGGKRLRNDVCGPRFVHSLPHRADWIPHDCAETTAYALAATIGFLGLHSEVQEDLYQQVMEVVTGDSDPVGHKVSRIVPCHDVQVPQTFEDFPRLEKVAHAFYEAVRLFRRSFFVL